MDAEPIDVLPTRRKVLIGAAGFAAGGAATALLNTTAQPAAATPPSAPTSLVYGAGEFKPTDDPNPYVKFPPFLHTALGYGAELTLTGTEVDEVVHITQNGTSGSFTLTYDGAQTDAIPYNVASGSALQTILNAKWRGLGAWTVSSFTSAQDFQLTHQGGASAITANNSLLNSGGGAGSGTVTISVTTNGTSQTWEPISQLDFPQKAGLAMAVPSSWISEDGCGNTWVDADAYLLCSVYTGSGNPNPVAECVSTTTTTTTLTTARRAFFQLSSYSQITISVTHTEGYQGFREPLNTGQKLYAGKLPGSDWAMIPVSLRRNVNTASDEFRDVVWVWGIELVLR